MHAAGVSSRAGGRRCCAPAVLGALALLAAARAPAAHATVATPARRAHHRAPPARARGSRRAAGRGCAPLMGASSREEVDGLIAEAAARKVETRAAFDAASRPQRLDEWLPHVRDGDQFGGKVTRVCGYGAFVELYIDGDPEAEETFLEASFDRPWRPKGLVHISSLATQRVPDVEAYVTAALGPVGSRVLVAVRSVEYNEKKRISLDLVKVLRRGDAQAIALRKRGDAAVDAARAVVAVPPPYGAGPSRRTSAVVPPGAEWLGVAAHRLASGAPRARARRTAAGRWAAYPPPAPAVEPPSAATLEVAARVDEEDDGGDGGGRGAEVVLRRY